MCHLICFDKWQEFYKGRRGRKGHLWNCARRKQGAFWEYRVVLKGWHTESKGKHGRDIIILSQFLNYVHSALMKDLGGQNGLWYRPFYDTRALRTSVINICSYFLLAQFFSSCYILSTMRWRDRVFYLLLNFYKRT